MAENKYAFMLKGLEGDTLALWERAQTKAANEGRTMKWVILALVAGWVKGIYHLGAPGTKPV
jgi:hypothetical protein